MKKRSGKNILVSVMTPAYNEAANLPVLYERLKKTMGPLGVKWEWILVDDHSTDGTLEVASQMARRDPRVRMVRFARNEGSHAAILCATRLAKGDGAAILACDLQDPPELLPELFSRWKKGAKVVWAVRESRAEEGLLDRFFAWSYYFTMRHFIGLPLPSTGADFCWMDRVVIEALRGLPERNGNIFLRIACMGFPQDSILYPKQKRVRGKSSWTFRKKVKLFADSVAAFSFGPIRLIFWASTALLVLGFAFLLLFTRECEVRLFLSLALILFGFQTLLMGILGEYLARSFEQARRRPPYLIETSIPRILE